MQELLKQTEANIAEVKKIINRLRYKRARTKHSTEMRSINMKILRAESMLADLLSSKAEIEEYLKRSENNV